MVQWLLLLPVDIPSGNSQTETFQLFVSRLELLDDTLAAKIALTVVAAEHHLASDMRYLRRASNPTDRDTERAALGGYLSARNARYRLLDFLSTPTSWTNARYVTQPSPLCLITEGPRHLQTPAQRAIHASRLLSVRLGQPLG